MSRYTQEVRRRNARSRRDEPEKWRARSAVSRAVKAGRLERPDHCSECGAECKPTAHHADYEKPLEVVWLCRLCHEAKH